MGIWIFHVSFKFGRHFVECVFICLKFLLNFIKMSFNFRVSGSPSRVRLCGGCLRRFGDLRKIRPWNLGACIFWILSIVVCF